MNTNSFVQYGEAKKPFYELTAIELKEVQERLRRKVRERAWAVGSPVYYGENGHIIAEYENGKKMIVENVDGKLVETREYDE